MTLIELLIMAFLNIMFGAAMAHFIGKSWIVDMHVGGGLRVIACGVASLATACLTWGFVLLASTAIYGAGDRPMWMFHASAALMAFGLIMALATVLITYSRPTREFLYVAYKNYSAEEYAKFKGYHDAFLGVVSYREAVSQLYWQMRYTVGRVLAFVVVGLALGLQGPLLVYWLIRRSAGAASPLREPLSNI